ncbi:cyclic nucleotide-binding domain-containing protein [archaeon]|nr:MAG: cyclic nucleotide-binding domain-containing protein [archaeon]
MAEKLLSVVSKSPLLRTLDAEQKDMIVRAFSGPLVVPEGQDVIKQGDIGDTFYLLESGRCMSILCAYTGLCIVKCLYRQHTPSLPVILSSSNLTPTSLPPLPLSGSVDVYIRKHGQDEIKVHTYKPGDSFGELAIMYNTPRAATCRVSKEATLWALDRISFKVIVVAQVS